MTNNFDRPKVFATGLSKPINLSTKGVCLWETDHFVCRRYVQVCVICQWYVQACVRPIILSANGVYRGMFETNHFVCQWCVQRNVWDSSFCLPMVCAGECLRLILLSAKDECRRVRLLSDRSYTDLCVWDVRQELDRLLCLVCQTEAILTSVSGVSGRS